MQAFLFSVQSCDALSDNGDILAVTVALVVVPLDLERTALGAALELERVQRVG